MEQHRRDELIKEYGEVASNFRLLTDIRFKLLAFLPIATAAAAALKGDSGGMSAILLSLFGLAVTVGLAIYNARNDQLYDELIGRAAEIERTLGLPDGAFANRPSAWLSLKFLKRRLKIDHRTGVGTIYAASIALWLFGVFLPVIQMSRAKYDAVTEPVVPNLVLSAWPYYLALALALICTFLAVNHVRKRREARQQKMRELASRAVQILDSIDNGESDKVDKFLKTCAKLADIEQARVESRYNFYVSLGGIERSHYMIMKPRTRALAHFVALLTDLPPRWIFDCAVGRREPVRIVRVSKACLMISKLRSGVDDALGGGR